MCGGLSKKGREGGIEIGKGGIKEKEGGRRRTKGRGEGGREGRGHL